MDAKYDFRGKGKIKFCPELPVYVICWVGAVVIAVVSLIISSQSLRRNVDILNRLEAGWSMFSYKDSSDLEWEDFKRALFYDLRWWFLGHAIITMVLRFTSVTTEFRCGFRRKVTFTLYGLAYAVWGLGLPCTCLMIIEVLSMFAAARIVATTSFVWFVTFAWIAVVQCFLDSPLVVMDDYLRSLQFSSLAYTILRSVYFSKHIISSEKDVCKSDAKLPKKDGRVGLLDCLNYCFYVPLLSFGQLLAFEEFQDQMNDIPRVDKSNLLKSVARVVIWGIFYEVLLQLCYPFALLSEESLLWSLPLWSVMGTAFIITQLFHVKYIILWSFTSSVAGLDGLRTPALPECTSHCHKSSSIWRTFDNGLHEFIKRNIYAPLGGSTNGFRNQLLAFFCSFIFLCCWHGLSSSIALFCLTSFVSAVVEATISHLFSNYHEKISHRLSNCNIMRIECIITTLNLALFLSGTLIFLGNSNLSLAVYYRTFVEGFPVSVLLYLFCTYSGLQTGRAWKDYKESRRTAKSS